MPCRTGDPACPDRHDCLSYTLAPHQLDALDRLMQLLDLRGGAILADDVGLGKSFVAAAVACAMRQRGYDVTLIVPASLVAQWREIVDAEAITHDALANDPRLPDLSRRRLLVVDEAHAFRNRKTQRWAALARRSIGARLLLVTATPICNSADDLFALVSLIAADDALRDYGVASIEEAFRLRRGLDAIVSALVVRRERDVLPPELYFGELERQVIRHPVAAAPIDELQFPLSAAAPLLRQFLWRRLESSDAALLESVRRQVRFYQRVLESGRSLTRRDYRRAFAHEEESEAVQQILFWDLLFCRTGDPACPDGHDCPSYDPAAIRDEMRRLDELRAFVERTPSLKHELLPIAGEPALIFTGSVATARDLARRLRCAVATSRDGIAAIDAFRRGRVDLVVSTDLAAEGLNLQRAAVVVHYDIPWNPVKLDQRNGRAFRIGQTRASVRAVYFLPERDRSRIVATVEAKNSVRAGILGGAGWKTALHRGGDIALPPHLPRDAGAVGLLRAIEAAGLEAPPIALRRWRAGIELIFAEMARELIDERRLRDLRDMLRADASV